MKNEGHSGPTTGNVLELVLERAREMGSQAVVAFDLDSTLFDNRPRQARILREFGAERAVPALKGCLPTHWGSAFDMKGAMRQCGLTESEVQSLYPEARRFWLERFFTSAYCVDDVPVLGAVEFVQALAKTGAQICYVTGRHEEMRAGTLEAMRRCGLPLPNGNVRLILKPAPEQHDDDFKREAHRHLSDFGVLIAAFDNEPTHVNDYRLTFPDASIVHLATDHSGRPVALLEGISAVPNFAVGARGSTQCGE
jgi:hypothetical protein